MTSTPGTPVTSEAGRTARKIQRLDEATVREIAAGEVVERPASVVKELVENAIDAGAREIHLRFEGGGLDLVEVADDGCGIPPEEFALAFERHATSKIVDAAELERVRTLGFRGEALASIAAVSRITLLSRIPHAEGACEMDGESGRLSKIRDAARAPGTTVSVRDLFFNTPARRKFLRSATSESLQITEVIERLYLANPSISFIVSTGGRERARYPAAASLREAAGNVLGSEFLESSFEFRGTGGPGIWFEGITSHPALTRGTSSRLSFGVNGRAIFSKPLVDGVRVAYLDVIPRGRFPMAVVNLTVEGGYVDVNVHPTKREVRFQDESELRESLRTLIRSQLGTAPRSHLATLPPSSPALASRTYVPYQPSTQKTLGEGVPGGPVTSPPLMSSGPAGTAPPLTPQIPTSRGGLRVLGQVGDLYIVTESVEEAGSMTVIDAHAASERIVYERLRASEVHSHQDLLSPVEIELTSRQVEVWAKYAGDISGLGFVVEPFGGRAYRIHAVPSFLWHRVRPERLGALLDDLSDGESREVQGSLRERVTKTVACHMAIRAGDPLTHEEMTRLLEDLSLTPENFTCPHGRPIMVTLTGSEIGHWFQR